MTIYVTDFNDERPLFDFNTYRTDICHTQSSNVVIIQPAATDRDSGSNSDITYSLNDVSSSYIHTTTYYYYHCPQASVMEVSPDSGSIHLVMNVDPEDIGSELTAIITANDGGNPMLSDTANVIVKILNCSQNPFRYHFFFYHTPCVSTRMLNVTLGLQNPFYEAEVDEGTDASGMILHDDINTMSPSVVTGDFIVFSPELSISPFEIVGTILTIRDQSLVD